MSLYARMGVFNMLALHLNLSFGHSDNLFLELGISLFEDLILSSEPMDITLILLILSQVLLPLLLFMFPFFIDLLIVLLQAFIFAFYLFYGLVLLLPLLAA